MNLKLSYSTKNPFQNPVINRLWKIFLGFLVWEVWREGKARTLKGKSNSKDRVSNIIKARMLETIRVQVWDSKYLDPNGYDTLILQA